MDELSKAEKALADAQAIVDKLFADLGNAVPGTAKYGSVQTAYEKAKDSFFSLWNATHKKPEEKFEANPFVWVVDFKINK